jgi:hypothetical protein
MPKLISDFLKDEEAIFRLTIALKMLFISVLSFVLLLGFLWTILGLDFIFFEANSYTGVKKFTEVYYDFLFSKINYIIPYIMMFFIFVFFMGMYVANLLLRPFKLIGEFCETFVEKNSGNYDPGFFSELKLLTSFSEYFFGIMALSLKNKKIMEVDIPKKYTQIHRPVFEKTFFLQFVLYILIVSIIISSAFYVFAVSLHEHLIELATQVMVTSPAVALFLKEQTVIFEGVLWGVLLAHFLLYCFLAFHLYGLVSAPSFAIFATMRSFLKGNYNSRVHLIGFSYVRSQSRKINKYLDYVKKTIIDN